ncbi:MAG: MobF family relaxase [Opitutaceae bacterium]|jgi:conjugative relaxase-like TrwC/TraI family protein
MLTAKPQLNLASAREYFREHLQVGDYYAEGQTVAGEWFGLGAETLNLKGRIEEADFLALCEGMNPKTGERLTARLNSHRHENGLSVANRRVFYDFTLSPPKSVSILGLCRDDRILKLHQSAVKTALSELEVFAETRVRKAGAKDERVTGNVIAGTFQHDTSRELDPHMHTHCIVFNATFDPTERRWKALEVQGMFRAQRFVENLYYHELSKGLRSLGYQIENNARDFEIRGMPKSLITRFSKRHEQIDAETRKRIDSEGTPADLNAVRRQVAVSKRQRKMKHSVADRLRPFWGKQMPPDEAKALVMLIPAAPEKPKISDTVGIVAWADEHLFSRKSVVYDHELWSAALARGRGENFDLAALRAVIDQRGYIHREDSRKLTAHDVLHCELEIVLAAKTGRGSHVPLVAAPSLSSSLSPEQRQAVEHIFGSRGFITLFRGGAGTGKSFTLKEVERGLSAAGHPVVVLAPQRQQVRDLQSDGLPAQTLAQVLTSKSLPPRAVVLLDEAGQVGGRELHALVKLVQAQHGRLILSGDTRQQGAVTASDALRAIETYSGLKAAEIRAIRRQDPKRAKTAAEKRFVRGYRAAVKAAAAGDIDDSFDRLDRLGCVREHAPDERHAALAAEYCAATERGENVLAVAQTWTEVHRVNDAIRAELKAAGRLTRDQTLTAYQPLNWDEAQKRDARFYEAGHHAVFLKRYGRFAKGDVCEIANATDSGLVLIKNGRRSTMSYRYADRITVASASVLMVAPGDRLQLKLNGRSQEGHAFSNGDLVTVREIRENGALRVEDAAHVVKTLSPAKHVFTRGYAVTSYASQGKTVDTVLLSDSACHAAINRNEWYVAISRGRRKVMVFTEDKTELRANIRRSGDRELALSLKSEALSETVRPRLSEWTRRALAAAEHIRVHRAVLNRIHQASQRRRIVP